jgi:hypothetical protein
MEMARTYLAEVKRHGLRRTYADSSADSPLDIYLKLGFEVAHRLVELRTAALPQADIAGIEPLDTATLLAEMPTFPPAPRSWIGRPAFLQSAASFLEFKGIRGSGRLDAYVAISRWAGETTIIALDFREGAEECGYRLISHLRTYPPPYSASHIVSGSRSERLLRDCGFHTGLQWVSIALALDTYLPRR